MHLFIDECLSPSLARELNESGHHMAEHPLDFGGRGQSDHTVLARCIASGSVIVTQNARDFKGLIEREEIHPGLIIMPCVGKDTSRHLLQTAITHLMGLGEPNAVMINKVLEIDERGAIKVFDLPEP